MFRQDDKERIVMVANRLALIGFGVLSVAMTGVILLVTDFLFGLGAAVPTAVCSALVFVSLWYGLPLARRRARRANPPLAPPAVIPPRSPASRV